MGTSAGLHDSHAVCMQALPYMDLYKLLRGAFPLVLRHHVCVPISNQKPCRVDARS